MVAIPSLKNEPTLDLEPTNSRGKSRREQLLQLQWTLRYIYRVSLVSRSERIDATARFPTLDLRAKSAEDMILAAFEFPS